MTLSHYLRFFSDSSHKDKRLGTRYQGLRIKYIRDQGLRTRDQGLKSRDQRVVTITNRFGVRVKRPELRTKCQKL